MDTNMSKKKITVPAENWADHRVILSGSYRPSYMGLDQLSAWVPEWECASARAHNIGFRLTRKLDT